MCKYGDLNFWTGVLWGGGGCCLYYKKIDPGPCNILAASSNTMSMNF